MDLDSLILWADEKFKSEGHRLTLLLYIIPYLWFAHGLLVIKAWNILVEYITEKPRRFQ